MKFFKKDELKLLWPFYLVSLFLTIFTISAVFMIPYLISLNLSLAQIGFLISSMAIAILLFEIPTGAIADIFGRKLSSLIGNFFGSVLTISIFFFKDFYSLLIIFFLIGISGTFISGASEAWVVDLLKYHKRKNLIQDYYSKTASFTSMGLFLAGFVGAFFVKVFGISIIWPISGVASFIAFGIFIFAKEHFIKKKATIKRQFKKTICHTKKSIKYSLKHQAIFIFLIAGFVTLFSGAFAGIITWYPFLINLGFKDYWFGYLFSASCAIGIFSPFFVKSLIKKFGGYKKYLVILLILEVLITLAVLFANFLYIALTIFLLGVLVSDLFAPARVTFFQSFIPGKMRATIDSFRNMAASLIAIVSFPLVGFLADNIGPQRTIVLGAFALIPAIILYSKINYKEKEKK